MYVIFRLCYSSLKQFGSSGQETKNVLLLLLIRVAIRVAWEVKVPHPQTVSNNNMIALNSNSALPLQTDPWTSALCIPLSAAIVLQKFLP